MLHGINLRRHPRRSARRMHVVSAAATSASGTSVMDALVLHLETFITDLESVHLFDGVLSRYDRVVADEAKSL